MKRFLFLIGLLFISTNVLAKCDPFDESKCTTIKCPQGTLMSDYGECYSCDEEEAIVVNCIGDEKASKICPNRMLISGCGRLSILCPKTDCSGGTFMGDDGKCYSCDEDENIDVNCLGEVLIRQLCPNRGIQDGFGYLKSIKCSSSSNPYAHVDCDTILI